MADAILSIKAVDDTKKAFASVQNNLARLDSAAGSFGKTIQKSFGLSKGLSTLAVALGVNMQSIAESLSRLFTGVSKDEEDALKKLEDVSTQNADSFAALMEARRTDEENLQVLLQKRISLERQVNSLSGSSDTESQVRFNEKSTELNKTNLAIIKTQASVEAERKSNMDAMMKASERLGIAQEKIYTNGAKEPSLRDKINSLREREGELLMKNVRDDQQGHDQKIANANQLAGIYEELSGLLEEQAKFGKELGDRLAMGFEDAILSGNKLSEVLRGLGQDILRMVFQQQVTSKISGLIGTGINALFGIPGKAIGGPVSANSPYVVGEKGPELFVPSSSGSIIPNGGNSGSGSAGGPSINVTYNIASGVSRNELVPILEQERRRLKAEIPDMVRRGGAYRSAFA